MRPAVVFSAANRRAGVERVAWDLSNYLGRNHDTTFVGRAMDDATDNAARFHQVPALPALPAPMDFRVAARRELQRLQPDVTLTLGANCPPGDVYWVQSVHRAYLSRSTGPTLRGIKLPAAARQVMPRHRLILGLEKSYFTNPSVHTILCTSQQEIDDLQAVYGVDRNRCRVMPNGFDPDLYREGRPGKSRAEIRSSLGLGEADVSLLFVANELHRKGFGPLIQAVARLGDPALRIDVVGRVSDADYRSQITKLGLVERIRWHGPTSDVAPFYSAADLFVLPTQYEPFGIVIVEALAAGLPVITSRLAGASPAVTRGDAGILLDDPTDVGELAAAIRAGADPVLREKWSQGARSAASGYAWPQIFEQVETLLEEVATSRR